MIIFISGSINSGKSTIAKILAGKLGNTALIEVDRLRDFIDWMPLEKSIPINLENTVAVIKVFVGRGMNLVIPYPLGKQDYEYLVSHLKEYQNQLYVFTLSPKIDKVLENRGSRELTDWEKERIKYHYDIGISNPSFGVIVDNTDQTPLQTAEQIFNSIKK